MIQLILLVLAAGMACVALAQSNGAYPNRPIRLIVPSAPGGSPDISSRMFAPEITRQIGQQLVEIGRAHV